MAHTSRISPVALQPQKRAKKWSNSSTRQSNNTSSCSVKRACLFLSLALPPNMRTCQSRDVTGRQPAAIRMEVYGVRDILARDVISCKLSVPNASSSFATPSAPASPSRRFSTSPRLTGGFSPKSKRSLISKKNSPPPRTECPRFFHSTLRTPHSEFRTQLGRWFLTQSKGIVDFAEEQAASRAG